MDYSRPQRIFWPRENWACSNGLRLKCYVQDGRQITVSNHQSWHQVNSVVTLSRWRLEVEQSSTCSS